MILENFTNGYDVTKGSMLAAGEKNDCAVRAFANAFNVTYDVAHSFTAENFKRKARKGTKAVYTTLNKLKSVTFDLFSDTLFPETKTYNLVCVHEPINADYTHKKVKYTVKIKPPYNKSLVCPKCKQILWIPLWEKTFKGNCNCKRLSKYE